MGFKSRFSPSKQAAANKVQETTDSIPIELLPYHLRWRDHPDTSSVANQTLTTSTSRTSRMGCLGRSPPLLPICWDGTVPAHKLVGAYGGARQQCVLMGSLQKVAIAISGE